MAKKETINRISKDCINLIKLELDKVEELSSNHDREEIGMFTIKTANQTLYEASLLPKPKSLWHEFWFEGELSCLFADSNTGKSILAVQIAQEISKKKKVIYFDFELSNLQFLIRYKDDNGTTHRFPDNFLRAEINTESLLIDNIEESIIDAIANVVFEHQANIIIIDNITFLNCATEKGDIAGKLMIQLTILKVKHNLSILVLAHTPKRSMIKPITQNDLAGSKRLFNLFDSVFAIGKSAKDTNLRYLKQLKVRNGPFTYDDDNVIICTINKSGSFLRFELVGYGTEKEHLRELSDNDISQEMLNVKELAKKGISYRKIANKLGISKSKVERILKKY